MFLFLKSVAEFLFVEFQQFQLLEVILFKFFDQVVVVVDCALDFGLDGLLVLKVGVG